MAAKDLPIEKIVFAKKAPMKTPPGSEVMSYSLDLAKSPKSIKAKTLAAKGMAVAGIYLVDEDKLKLCLIQGDKNIPAAFATKPGDEVILLELKREKK
jgi:uncharacterized protein (TIGR03067 family)